jgi:arylsulfatase A-like enzyme
VVLITLCSLRKDHVGVYGAVAPSPTPSIDRLARGGWHFSRAYAASNFTLASLTAVLTGRFGSTTGVTHWDKGLTADVPTLPEVLGLYGYKTAAFTMDAYSGFRPDYGLDRGFQLMDISGAPRSTPDGRRREGASEPTSLSDDGASAMPASRWLEEQTGSDPVFVMFHSSTAHYPFVISDAGAADDPTGVHQALWDAGHIQRQQGAALPSDAGGTRTVGAAAPNGQDPLKVLVDRVGQPAVDRFRDHYRDAVARCDVDVRRLVEAQERRGRLDKTIWLVVADHGEPLNDHGELLHGAAFYDTVINVPLVVSVPGLSPRGDGRSDSLVSHVDLMPTVLELVGAVTPVDLDGASMVPLLTGTAAQIRSVALSEGGVTRPRGNHLPGAVISPPWALLRHEGGCDPHSPRPPPGEPTSCLFNLDDDPGQDDVLTTLHQARADELLGLWTGFRADRAGTPLQLQLDPDMIAELQRTGYDFRLKSP